MNQKPGLMLYGLVRQAAPFFGGTLCVYQVIRRSPGQSSGGNPLPPDCSGTYDFFVTHAAMQVENFYPGITIYAQIWSRDSGFPSPDNVGLTNALSFTVQG